ncbi:TDP-N-acetylfucosamine:lipid II N-acetylfucosaminyltransferase [Kineosporia babensis]|uniref:TDP-N-acetylfucosamine:lipid II N-acetylfucosaminyltransferase n=1 Tax=Kineosporia babensis TaxID=499548 RepID=A0A9X1NB64_9ACTN|nr:TDP-N-acetylfucosamine:lipid II N-acetylfucosaminyltransferase [Kineosporia babensis]MCD5310619.1 TDP-N-acetylfucosamine:lipid II N-acetylfucosaminyltransferase [Kineosporia babensis]
MIHLLGTDIPHHNAALLTFFDQVLAPEQPERPVFWVVSRTPGRYPHLDVRHLPDQASLGRAVIWAAMTNRREHFFLHGQFNPVVWAALLARLIKPDQVTWHIWGGDLHESLTGAKANMLYRARRCAQGRIGRVLGTRGDLAAYSRRHPATATDLLYFPTPSIAPEKKSKDGTFTVLVGNSGDRSNRHIEALLSVRERFGRDVRVIVPLAHPNGNEFYRQQVDSAASGLFTQADLITEWLSLQEFSSRIAGCNLAYLPARRQQGIGTLSLLLRHRIPVVLDRENEFIVDLTQAGVPFLLDGDDLSPKAIELCRERLAGIDLDAIPFVSGPDLDGWMRVLNADRAAAPAFSFDTWFTLLLLVTSYLGVPLSALLVVLFSDPGHPAGAVVAALALPVAFYTMYRAAYAVPGDLKIAVPDLSADEARSTSIILAGLAGASLAAFVARNGLLLFRITSYGQAFGQEVRLIFLKRFTYYLIPAAMIVYLRRPTRARWLAFLLATAGFGALTYLAVGGVRANLAMALAFSVALGIADGHLPARLLPVLGFAGTVGMFVLALGRYRLNLAGASRLHAFLYMTRDTFSPWEHLALILSRRKTVEHQGIRPILRDFQVFVPHRLWPGRPDITLNTAKYFTWKVHGGERLTSLSPTLIGSAWIMGGLGAVAAVAASTGSVVRVFDTVLEKASRPQERPGDAVLTAFALSSAFNLVVLAREGLDSFVSRTVVQAGVFGAAVGLARRLSRGRRTAGEVGA